MKESFLDKVRRTLQRWKYTVISFRNHAARLNRCVDVENELLRHAAKGEPMTAERCKELAYKLGVPAYVGKNAPYAGKHAAKEK